MVLCDEDSDLSCDTCKEYTYTSCTNINILTTNLVAGTEYHLFIVDQFGTNHPTLATINGNKSFDIDTSLFPPGLFNSNSGKLEIFLSTLSDGSTRVLMTIAGTSYDCVLGTFNVAISDVCCDVLSPVVCETLCEKIDNNTAAAIAACILTDEDKTEDVIEALGGGICEPIIVSNSDDSFSVETAVDLELADITFNVYVNEVLDQTFSAPSMKDLEINIS